MILKGSQRGGGRALAKHLLNEIDNDFVEVAQIKKFISSDVTGAFLEIEAISKATRCTQPYFSLSLSPPKGATPTMTDFENAIDQVEEKLGLQGQPRVVVLHEKADRTIHAHCVWSRINSDIKAINMRFYKERLTELSRELYLAHGWPLPKGLADKSLSDPTNFSLEEFQTAKRAQRDPREIKGALSTCWESADNAMAFAAALKERGFWLAQGDRRGFVALDWKGTVYSLSRWIDTKPKELKARLGDPVQFPSVNLVKAEIGKTLGNVATKFLADLELRHRETMAPLLAQKRRIVGRQREQRALLEHTLKERREAKVRADAMRFRSGIKGIFDWLTGRRQELRRTIERENEQARTRELADRQVQRQSQFAERRDIQSKIELQRRAGMQQKADLAQALDTAKAYQVGDNDRVPERNIEHEMQLE